MKYQPGKDVSHDVRIRAGSVLWDGELHVPSGAAGIVLFEAPAALEQVSQRAAAWFNRHLKPR